MRKIIENYNNIQTTTSQSDISFSINKISHSESELSVSWHEEIEILHILEGEGTFTIDGRNYNVRSDSFIILNPYQIHSAKAHIGRPLTCESLKFKYEMLLSVFPDSVSKKYILPLIENSMYLPNTILPTMPIHKKVHSLYEIISDQFKDSLDYKYILIKSYILHLVYLFHKERFVYRRNISTKERPGTELVRESINYLHDHYQEELDLDYMCVNLETSKPNLCRVFKRHTNKTITTFLNEYRIQKACDLLMTTDFSIQEISYKVGYTHLSYFNTRFKKATYLTPKQFREAYKK